MLTAHANTTAEDFIAQLRTYVIAMGLGTQVVDCVDNLRGADDAQHEAGDGALAMRNEILSAVGVWFTEFDLSDDIKDSLFKVISGVEI